jgi:hypothetical protein
MVADSRYCLDEVQQANAIVAAMCQELLIIEDHFNAGGISRANSKTLELL